MTTLAAFLFAIALLVAVHEWGHYRMARACGVKVLRFSVGFGPRVFAWTSPRSGTEYQVAWIPLGGYVRMLDEAEGPVPADQRHLAFNHQPLSKRAAIVMAGPAANLGLALILYSAVYWMGVDEPLARLARPPEASLMAQAGVRGGETVTAISVEGEDFEAIESFEDLRWQLARAALDGQDVSLQLHSSKGRDAVQATLPLSTLDVREADAALLRTIGVVGPFSPAVLGDVLPEGAAAQAGLQPGDQVLRLGPTQIADGSHLRELIRASGKSGFVAPQEWVVMRGGQQQTLSVTPKVEQQDGLSVGRIGAVVGAAPELVTVRSGVVDGFLKSARRTWEVSELTVRMMGRMLIGEASLKNISGPITIADYAGRSASVGWIQFMQFLALISVSLGVINLLPLPVLDGGHLMYYLWEGATGRPVSELWQSILQRAGIAVLMLMMSVAMYNDIARLLL